MSYFDDASLVMIPSGYKTSKVYSVKPTSGDGDLTFTRSNDTATRVGPDGLIEKVRTNLILQSNTFSTTWSPTNVSVTGGQAGYDGSSNAWLINITGGTSSQRVNQTISASGVLTLSVYAKAGTLNWISLRGDAPAVSEAYFNLATGTLGSLVGAAIDSSIESVGSGWYRCSVSFIDTTIVRIYLASGNGNINQSSGNIYLQDAMLESGDVMTDYIATTTAAVSVGPVANVPRLDYLNSSCPRLLLEPQRTSLVLFSESFDNAAWNKSNTSVTANQAVSPDGYTNADKLVENTSSSFHDTNQQSITYTAAAYTISVFAKAAGRNHIFLQIFDGVTFYTSGTFNLSNGTVSGSGSIVSYGNGWYRCSFTATTASGGGGAYINLSNGTTGNYAGDGTSGVFIYGAQVESGAYATSYIPTLGAAVTRGADAASKTGISSLIGQTEGSVVVDLNLQVASKFEHLFNIFDSTNTESILVYLRSTNRIRFAATGTTNYDDVEITSGRHKVAVVWSGSSISYFRDGVKLTTRTGFAKTLTFSDFYLGNRTDPDENPATANQVLLFTTALSDADAIALTA